MRPRRITGRGPASLLPPTARYAALGMSSPSSTEGTDSAGHPPGNSLVGAHTSAASYCSHTRSHRSMSIAAAASMPWLNVCSVYRSRGISTRQGRGVASTEARAILARHLPGLFNIFPSRNSSWTTNARFIISPMVDQYENFEKGPHTTLASHERFRHLPAEEEHFARLGRPTTS